MTTAAAAAAATRQHNHSSVTAASAVEFGAFCHLFPANTGFGLVVFLLHCEGPKEQKKKGTRNRKVVSKRGKRLPLCIFFAVVSVFLKFSATNRGGGDGLAVCLVQSAAASQSDYLSTRELQLSLIAIISWQQLSPNSQARSNLT